MADANSVQALPTWELIGARYLDTQHDAAYLQQLEAALAQRGVTGWRRLAYEYVAASSLWWNMLWWNWSDLGKQDIQLGWMLNLLLWLPLAGLVGWLADLHGALLALLGLHVVCTGVGVGLRSGSARMAQRDQDKDGDCATPSASSSNPKDKH